jgi:hypothetical protein
MRGIERCNSKWINAEWLDNEVFKSISQLLSNPIYFGNKWLTIPDVSELEKEIDRIKSRLGELDSKIKKAYDLITMVEGFETEKEYKKLLENDIAEQQKLKSKLILKETELNDKSNSKKLLKELKDYYQDRDNKPLSDIWKPSLLDDEYESKFKEYLLNLPFKEKKRILEAVISPGFGGKCILRHKRYSDQCDPADIQKEMEAEISKIKRKLKPRERLKEERRILDKIYTWDKENPLINENPVFDLNFTIDLNKLKTIIAGLSKNDLLEKFDHFGTSGRL